MNRLLQGDVGSGKTVVALLTMLIAIDNGFQACMMAPTEILATQHYEGLKELLADMDIELELLTGSVKTAKRREIHEKLENGTLNMTLELSGFFHEPLLWEQGMVNYSLIYNNETVFSVEINKSIENFNFTLTNFTGNITIQINSSGSDDPTDNNPGDFYIAKTRFEIIN